MKYEDGHEDLNESTVLEGLTVLDVGCGGGLLSEVSPIHVVLFGRILTLMPVESCSAWCKHPWNRCFVIEYRYRIFTCI